MKYIITILTLLLLTSCANKPEEIKTAIKQTQLPEYRFVNVEPKDFEFKTYNSGEIIGINKLEERYVYDNEVLDLETMEIKKIPRYQSSSSCGYAMCLRYRLRVQYKTASGVLIKDEFVTEVDPRDTRYEDYKAELIDDSDFYYNIPQ